MSTSASLLQKVKRLLEEKNRIIEEQKLEISKLKQRLEETNNKIKLLEEEREKLEEKVKSLEREVAKLRMQASLKRILSEKIPEVVELGSERGQVVSSEAPSEKAKGDVEELMLLVARYLTGDKNVRKTLEERLLNSENVKVKVLLLLSEGSKSIDQLASSLKLNEDSLLDHLKELMSMGCVKVEGRSVFLPYMTKGVEVQVAPPTTITKVMEEPKTPPMAPPSPPPPPMRPSAVTLSRNELSEKWRDMRTVDILNEIAKIVQTNQNPADIAMMLEVLSEILESRLKTFGGRIRYEIGREIKAWRSGHGSINSLIEKLADWKDRIREQVTY
ncbi:MAG: ArsR family transcriptional regulator [Candidatus Baldrarchaeia archaeon]